MSSQRRVPSFVCPQISAAGAEFIPLAFKVQLNENTPDSCYVNLLLAVEGEGGRSGIVLHWPAGISQTVASTGHLRKIDCKYAKIPRYIHTHIHTYVKASTEMPYPAALRTL